MPRACVIVLDAVGAGDLPDAAGFGDAGSSNARRTWPRRSAGSSCRTCRRSGSATSCRSPGCPPRPGAPVRGGAACAERSLGKDTTTGPLGARWASITRVAMPTYPDGFPARRARRASSRRTGRGVIGNVAGLGHGDHPASWATSTGGPASGSSTRRPTRVFQIAAHEDVSPARRAVRSVPHRRASNADRARTPSAASSRARSSASPGSLRAHCQPARLLARAAAAEPPRRGSREAGCAVHGRGQDRRHLRRARTSTRRLPTAVERRGHRLRPRGCCEEVDARADLHQPRRTST